MLGWLAWRECAALKQNWFEVDYLHVCSHLCNFLLPFGTGGEMPFQGKNVGVFTACGVG